ncbi:hypothetical protein GUJ93_ZPchr0003g16515 [Zizania palustris]|uniref:RING-type domain-containing protein n=1 Tax=Zizania palustris TaxID=103762 RepID=A0A8J5RZ59_ZIZPA|nr:hypothetical protein GUJ93_ZPchr0003g16515 [Zizania palustris]
MARRCLTSSSDLHGLAVKFAVAGNAVVAVLLFAFVVWRIFFWGRDEREGGGQGGAGAAPHEADGAASSSSGGSSPCASPRASGLGKEALTALPVYVHSASAEAGGTAAECAVCIVELRDGDTGRLLPRCGHRFHAECVDRWFRSHATCPLCRAAVADGCPVEADPKVVQPQGALDV